MHDLTDLVPVLSSVADTATSSSSGLEVTLISAAATVVAGGLAFLAVFIRRPEPSKVPPIDEDHDDLVILLRTNLTEAQAAVHERDVTIRTQGLENDRLRTKLWRNHIDPDGVDHGRSSTHS